MHKKNLNKIPVVNDNMYYLGIDGGGTKTVLKLVDNYNNEIKTLIKGPSNPNDIGLDNSLQILKNGIFEICSNIPLSCINLFAGISGCGNYPEFSDFINSFGFYNADYGTDFENLTAFIAEEKYVISIIGTGFVTFAVDGDKKTKIGGWGQYFDNGGSGFNIGKDAISAALSDIDGSGEKTLITKLIEEKTEEKVNEHLSVFYQKGKKYIAEFSETVFLAAEQNDKKAINILEKNCSYVAEKVNTALNLLQLSSVEKIPIYFAGGLINRKEILFPLIEKNISAGEYRCLPIDFVPVDGAIIRAMRLNKK